MRRSWIFSLWVVLALALFNAPLLVSAQETTPTPNPNAPPLTVFTPFPSQVVGVGETVSMDIDLVAGIDPQTVQLEMGQIPDGWTATFRGGGQIIQSAYVQANSQATVQLRLEPPANVAAGSYNFTVIAQGKSQRLELPITLTVQEKLPPSLSFSVDLPTLRGSPSTTFRYSATLKNEGDEDLTVNLTANAPQGLQVSFSTSGQDVTDLPIGAKETKSISISAQPVGDLQAGSYPFTVQAQGGNAQAELQLTAEVTGQAKLSISAPDGRLSADAYTGQSTPVKVTIANTGTAPAQNIELSSSEPTGWAVTFDPQKISDLPAGQQIEVTARITPPDKAVAGDYMVTVRANMTDGGSQSTDFRITVLTSTLWGVVGIGLVAISVGVVALAVVRFGRR